MDGRDDEGCRMRRGRAAWRRGVKALEAAVPGWGAARERRWRPCSMTSIVVVVVIVVLIVVLIVVVVKIRKGEM